MPNQSTAESIRRPVRHLIVILGDQLDRHSPAFDGFDSERDIVWMAEVIEESIKVPVSLPRIAIFLACMRHFRDASRRFEERAAMSSTRQGRDGRAW